MNLSGSRSRLAALSKELHLRWVETRYSWRDSKAEEFERRANHPQLWSPDPTYTAAASLTRKQIAELKGGGDG